MHNIIKKFFLHDRTYQKGVSLYMQFGKSQSLQRQLNLQEQNADLHAILFEELRSLGEIPTVMFEYIMATPVALEDTVPPLQIPVIPTKKVKDPAKPASNQARQASKQATRANNQRKKIR